MLELAVPHWWLCILGAADQVLGKDYIAPWALAADTPSMPMLSVGS
jgi:hypothetical protein